VICTRGPCFGAIGFGMVWLSVYKERKTRFVLVVRVSGQSGLAWFGSVFIRSGKPDLYSWSAFRASGITANSVQFVFSIIIVIFESIRNTTKQAKFAKRVVKHDVFFKFSIGA
jgi:hypothetical protein